MDSDKPADKREGEWEPLKLEECEKVLADLRKQLSMDREEERRELARILTHQHGNLAILAGGIMFALIILAYGLFLSPR
jgi:hypothetical protein